MVNADFFRQLDRLGIGCDVNKLEQFIENAHIKNNEGKPIVSNSEYAVYRKILENLKPNSSLLSKEYKCTEIDKEKANNRYHGTVLEIGWLRSEFTIIPVVKVETVGYKEEIVHLCIPSLGVMNKYKYYIGNEIYFKEDEYGNLKVTSTSGGIA